MVQIINVDIDGSFWQSKPCQSFGVLPSEHVCSRSCENSSKCGP
jgi:hypothetical protein